jgi:hypothetical protein
MHSKLKAFLVETFWGFGKPKSEFQRRVRMLNRALIIPVVIYGYFAFFPQVLFAHNYTYENYTLHSHSPLPAETAEVMKRADSLLQKSDLFSRNKHHQIFICDGTAQFNFFFMRSGAGAFAIAPGTGNVFVQFASPQHDLAWKGSDTNVIRSLSGLIAHEVTHNHIRERLGMYGAFRLPTWKNEGFAERVSIYGQADYEREITQHMPGKIEAGYSNPNYRRFLKRVVEVMGPEPDFEKLLSHVGE